METLLEKLQGWWGLITAGFGLLIAIAGSYGAAYVWASNAIEQIDKVPAIEKDVEQLAGAVQQLQTASLWQEWINLDNKRKRVGLSPQEHARWCQLGLKLKALSTCPNWIAGPQN